jgi:hypothetical protein
MYMWYRSFGIEPKDRLPFMHPVGLRPSIVLLALLMGPLAAIAWTIGYFTSAEEDRYK